MAGDSQNQSAIMTTTAKAPHISSRSAIFEKGASQKRLHIGGRGTTVSATNTTTYKKQIGQLKEQRTISVHNVDVSLYHYASQNKTAKVVDGATPGRELYEGAPWQTRTGSSFTSMTFSNRDRMSFYVGGGRTIGHLITPDQVNSLTVRQWFDSLAAASMLSEKHKKEKVIPINLCIHEQPDSAIEDDDDDVEYYGTFAASNHRSSLKSSPAKSAMKRKRGPDASNAISVKRPVYESAFKLPHEKDESSAVSYLTYSITITSCMADNKGTISNATSVSQETINIAKNWKADLQKYLAHQKDNSNSDFDVHGSGTFIGRGSSKVAFLVSFKNHQYAILQIGPLGQLSSPNAVWGTEEDNMRDLLNELRLLTLGQYFVASFYRRADCYKSKLPKIRFNSMDAFIGTITASDASGVSHDLTPDTPPLLWKTFLAVPYIDQAQGYESHRKFSGAFEVGNNTTSLLGNVVDAFAHHVLVDSMRTCVLVDLQGFVHGARNEVVLIDPQAHTHNWPGSCAYWDHGVQEIEQFEKAHTCNSICRKLDLKPVHRMSVQALCD
ncbi:hypothetical protein EUX98_g9204 [Antrodiella citrinella]|uniref:Alpha-type protein kinase domain-containing protein n=1 Tax=Antrodiella citrinella TaxID=2447956 RepID=A0A4S4LWR8_9APHY|nr:hypothetical protein EUX98_g9204 [Antrodiella citrinella]